MNRKTTRPGFWTAAGVVLLVVPLALVTHGEEAENGGAPSSNAATQPPTEIPHVYPPEAEALRGKTEAELEAVPIEDYPIWVSARAFYEVDGEMSGWELLEPQRRSSHEAGHKNRLRQLEEARARGDQAKVAALSQCPDDPTGYFRSYHGSADQTLEDLTGNARSIYRGTVIERDSGFVDGLPTTVLLMRKGWVLKQGEEPLPARLLVEYRYADFRIGDNLFCWGVDRNPPVPAVGDSILVFAFGKPTTSGMVGGRHEKILFERPNGTDLSLPKTLREDPQVGKAKNLAEIEAQVEALLAGQGGAAHGKEGAR
jgi:hypothetical protein